MTKEMKKEIINHACLWIVGEYIISALSVISANLPLWMPIVAGTCWTVYILNKKLIS